MDTRFFLRFETGDRQGERIALPDGTLRIGRKSANGLVIRHGSVSGHHAELVVEGSDVELVDLESTNGTKVEGQRIQRHGLFPGDAFSIGAIELRLMVVGAGASAPVAGTDAGEDDEPFLENFDGAPSLEGTHVHVQRANLDNLERKGPGSRLALVGLAVVAVAAGGFYAWQRLGQGGGKTSRVAIPAVEGNLILDGAFEGEGEAWANADQAPQAFQRGRAFAHTGLSGLGARLEAGEWAFARSPAVALTAGRRLVVSGSLEAVGGCDARLGFELRPGGEGAVPLLRWAPAQRAAAGNVPVELGFDVPPGFPAGSVVVAAREAGEARLDDVAVLLGAPAGPAVRFNENELHQAGAALTLTRSGRVIFADLGPGRWSDQGLEGDGVGRVTGAAAPKGFTFQVEGDALRLRGGPGLAPESGQGNWLATVGPDGYRAQALPFERAETTGILLGAGIDQLLVAFPAPVAVRGSLRVGELFLAVDLGVVRTFDLQLTFAEERAEAARIAQEARAAERDDEAGRALALWSSVLDRFPFEQALVAEAEAARGRMIEAGLAQLDGIRQELERARFFALTDLFEDCRDRVDVVALAYEGTEVEREARSLRARVEAEIQALGGVRHRGSGELLRGVLEALDPAGSPRLVEHLRKAADALGVEREEQ